MIKKIFFPLLFPLAAIGQTLEGGNGHAIILDKTGHVWTVGRNNYGQLGDSTTTNSARPLQVKKLEHIAVVARGYDHSMALDSSGSLWAWGRNNYGQAGSWAIYDQLVPHLVIEDAFTAIEGGHWHSVGLKKDGTVLTWGHNYFGELGNGTREHSSILVAVKQVSNGDTAILNDVVSIASVGYHVLVLKKDGTVWGWGSNDYNQLGKEYPYIQPYAVKIQHLPHMKMIGTGWHHSVGLDSSGNIWTWGSDPAFQVGEEIGKIYPEPIMFEKLPRFTMITCGSWHTLAIDEQKNVWSWGNNIFGMLGTGDSIGRSSPVMIPNLKNITEVGAGCFQSIVRDGDGLLFTFGDNPSGQLGNDSIARCYSPIPMSLDDINRKLPLQASSSFPMDIVWKSLKYLLFLSSILLNIFLYRKLKASSNASESK